MRTVAIISQKGGSGKTTLAMHLAAAADGAGLNAGVIDLDPQGSASQWGDRRRGPPEVLAIPAHRLAKTIETAREGGFDLLVIDTAARSEGDAAEAARVSDLVLITCRPSALDLGAIPATIKLALRAERPAHVVLCQATPNARKDIEEATEIIAELGCPVCPVTVHQRAAFRTSAITGQTAREIEPAGKAAAEIDALLAWLGRVVDLSSARPTETTTHRKASA